MSQISTPNYFIQQLYNETVTTENALLENNILSKEAFLQLQETKNALDEDNGLMPNKQTIISILRYSRNNTPTTV